MKSSRAEICIHEILEQNGVNFEEGYALPCKSKAPYNHYIYVHINKINGKGYVGQTTNPKERWSRNGSRYKECVLFYKAIQKYGWDNFEHIIIEQGLTSDEANNREQFWIKTLNTFDKNFGYNLTPGGNNYMSELWQDEDFRRHMVGSFSEARKKSWSNPEFKEKAQKYLQEGLQRAWNDPQWRKARIENLQGDKNPNSKMVRNLETGKVFSTIKEATEWAGLKSVSCIGQNCRGNKKSAGHHPVTGEKLHWEFIKG